MSGWKYKGGATSVTDFLNASEGGYGPWKIDVGSTQWIPVDSHIEFTLVSGNELEMTILSPAPNTVIANGPAYYEDHTVTGHPEGAAVYLTVNSLAKFTKNGEEDWHLYGLSVEGDPQDVGVIGACGGC